MERLTGFFCNEKDSTVSDDRRALCNSTRPERWIVTIPSSDQWLATIGNHWKTIATNGFGDKKTIEKPLLVMVFGPKSIGKPLLPMVLETKNHRKTN